MEATHTFELAAIPPPPETRERAEQQAALAEQERQRVQEEKKSADALEARVRELEEKLKQSFHEEAS